MSALATLGPFPVCLVGAGKMGMALARGWMSAGLPPEALTLVDPQPAPDVSREVADWGATLSSGLPARPPRVVVLAVKPQIMTDALAGMGAASGPDTLFISIAAGISLAALARGAGTDRVVRAMPNTPAQIGKGMTGAVAGPGVGDRDREIAQALLGSVGPFEWLESETLIDAVTAVSGSGPAYVFALVEALAAAAEAQGLAPEPAMIFARQTVVGAAALLEADPAPAARLRENVTSPGGTTAAGLGVLLDPESGLGPLLNRTVAAARARSEELGR